MEMMRVELRTPKGTAGVIDLKDGTAVPRDDVARRITTTTRIVEPVTLAVLEPGDGERYMRALPYTLSGTYMWATVVEDS